MGTLEPLRVLTIPWSLGRCVLTIVCLGYPIATLPLSYLEANGCPFGFVALAGAHREASLVRVQAAWEGLVRGRRAPPAEV